MCKSLQVTFFLKLLVKGFLSIPTLYFFTHSTPTVEPEILKPYFLCTLNLISMCSFNRDWFPLIANKEKGVIINTVYSAMETSPLCAQLSLIVALLFITK